MSILTKVNLTAIGLWLLALIVLFVFPHFLPIVSGFAIMLSLPVALVLLILAFIALIKDRNKRWSALSLGLILLVSYVALRQITRWGAFANFYLNKGSYEATAKRMVSAHNDAERIRICGEECWLMSTNPPRVAFHYVHGFLNWQDIIYDPSGMVVGPKTYDERKQLNPYFDRAEHLTGDWYLGYFGD